MPYYYGDSGMLLLVLFVALLGFIASARVKSTFKKYSETQASYGLAANAIARRLLEQNGCDTALEKVSGSLTDHFNPKTNVVGLSDTVYFDGSVAAYAVAAHEIGHVMQYRDDYYPIRFRNALVPVANIGSTLSPWIVLAGILMGSYNLAIIGAGLFGAIFLFQLVTLPVELNASRRALDMLTSSGYILPGEEEDAARKVLRAAAMTYVVAALGAFVSFLRLVLMAGRVRKR